MRLHRIGEFPSDGKIIFDSNIFIYSALDHPSFGRSCKNLISKVEAKDIMGLVPTFILNETFHRLMIAEMIKNKLAENTKEAIDKLKADPKLVPSLSVCWEGMERIFGMGFVILREKENTFLDSIQISKKYCLLAKDAFVASIAKDYGVENIATNDADFERVDFLKVWRP